MDTLPVFSCKTWPNRPDTICLWYTAHKKDAWYKAAAYGFTSADETLFIPLIEAALLPPLPEDKQELFDAARLLLKEDELPQQDFEALQERMLTGLRSCPVGTRFRLLRNLLKGLRLRR